MCVCVCVVCVCVLCVCVCVCVCHCVGARTPTSMNWQNITKGRDGDSKGSRANAIASG